MQPNQQIQLELDSFFGDEPVQSIANAIAMAGSFVVRSSSQLFVVAAVAASTLLVVPKLPDDMAALRPIVQSPQNDDFSDVALQAALDDALMELREAGADTTTVLSNAARAVASAYVPNDAIGDDEV